MKSCFNIPDFHIVTTVMKKICRYHKRQGQEYKLDDIVRNFCSDAFFIAYPYCLSLLYNSKAGNFKLGKIELHCPNPAGITFQVKRIHRQKLPIRIAKKIFTWFIGKILYPIDWADWHIQLTVIKSLGNCPAKFKSGDTYWFNIRRLDELCPASFYTLYPFLILNIFGYKLPWQNEGEKAQVHCPDHEGMIYSLEGAVNLKDRQGS